MFLVLLKYFGIFKSINAGLQGFRNLELMNFEIVVFEIMKSAFYCTKLKQINSRKFLNLFLIRLLYK